MLVKTSSRLIIKGHLKHRGPKCNRRGTLMSRSILVALPVFLAVNFYAVASNFSTLFIDTKALIVVLGVGIAFALCGRGGWLSNSKLSSGAVAAVIAGWLGALYGSVMILASVDERAYE